MRISRRPPRMIGVPVGFEDNLERGNNRSRRLLGRSTHIPWCKWNGNSHAVLNLHVCRPESTSRTLTGRRRGRLPVHIHGLFDLVTAGSTCANRRVSSMSITGAMRINATGRTRSSPSPCPPPLARGLPFAASTTVRSSSSYSFSPPLLRWCTVKSCTPCSISRLFGPNGNWRLQWRDFLVLIISPNL